MCNKWRERGRHLRQAPGLPAKPAEETSHALSLSSCGVGWVGVGGECDLFVVVLSGLQAVVQAAEESVEQVALGGGVTVAGGLRRS